MDQKNPKCPRCHGTGIDENYMLTVNPPKFCACKHCNGKGFIRL